MKLAARGTLWFGLYAALVLAPLVLAAICDPIAVTRPSLIELGVAFGFVGFALIAIECALVSRLHLASEPLGTDALMLFHRKMGIAALAFVAAHALLLVVRTHGASMLNPLAGSVAGRSGAIALWGLLILVASSIWRRKLALRYERWRLLHGLLAFVVTGAMLVHALAVGGYSGAPLVRGVLIAYAALFLALMVRFRVVHPLISWRRPWEIVENRPEGGDTRTLVLRPVGHRGIEFEAGQFVWITTGRTPFSAEEHPMSIASSAERAADDKGGLLAEPGRERPIELSIKALGDWSRSTVPGLRSGTRVWIDGPFGAFTLDAAAAQGFVMIAGGIGITPLRSMLLTMRDRGDRRPALLVYAARNRERAIFASELEQLQREIDLSIVFVFEDAEAGWQGERGYVTAEFLRRHVPMPLRLRHFFVCGPGPMMDALEHVLLELGVSADRVRTERFDMV
jgi:predicted ferric reductase